MKFIRPEVIPRATGGQINFATHFCGGDGRGIFLVIHRRRHGTDEQRWAEKKFFRQIMCGGVVRKIQSHSAKHRATVQRDLRGERVDVGQQLVAQADEFRDGVVKNISFVAEAPDFTRGVRAVALDFPNDSATHNLTDEFLFGPALLVCPVTTPMYFEKNSQPIVAAKKSREVYLPAGCDWYDFWTDEVHAGGQTIIAAAPLETLPLFVRAGSILPLTEVMQFVDEIPAAPYEIRIYRGADGVFTLYEDAGDGYDYERRQFATVDFSWNEARGELTISEREGIFPELVKEREYKIIFISPRGRQAQTIRYQGQKTQVFVSQP